MSKNFQTGRDTSTMACNWHVPQHNGFHDLYGGHVHVENGNAKNSQWACGF